MHLSAVRTLLWGILAWKICGVELRLCDDRIVFPDDDDEPRIYNQNSTSTSTSTTTTESPLSHSTMVGSDSDAPPPLNDSTTTTELPTLDNRILIETLPVCPPGQRLRAGRCRQSA